MRAGLGVEGGDSNSCTEKDRKRRAVVFVTPEPIRRGSMGMFLTSKKKKTELDAITFL